MRKWSSKTSNTQSKYNIYIHIKNTSCIFSMPRADWAKTKQVEREKKKIKPAALLMLCRIIRQHCDLYIIHICHFDNQQRVESSHHFTRWDSLRHQSQGDDELIPPPLKNVNKTAVFRKKRKQQHPKKKKKKYKSDSNFPPTAMMFVFRGMDGSLKANIKLLRCW